MTLLRLPAVLHFFYGSVSSLCPHWFRAQEIVATDDLRRVDLAGHRKWYQTDVYLGGLPSPGSSNTWQRCNM